MTFFGFGKPKTKLGIDIGTASIKIVELSKEGGRFKLQNYGLFELENVDETIQAQKTQERSLEDEDIVGGIKETIKKANMSGRDAVASIPSYSTFATVITLPYLSKGDIAKAIPFEARKYIPLPLKEVVLDWSIVGVGNVQRGLGTPDLNKPAESDKPRKRQTPPVVEVFIAAVPKDEISRYQGIMKKAGLNLRALELENMSLIRALVGNDRSPLAIVNLGGRSTSIMVIDGGVERVSHNYEVGGFEITKSIARSLNIDLKRAEELKRSQGFKDSKLAGEAMFSLVDMMIFETKKTISSYENKKKSQNVKIRKVLLVGGLVGMPNFVEYFREKMGIDVEIGSPFSRIIFPEKLKPLIRNLGSTFAIAIGLATRKI